jgi:hypothetical protein
MANPLQIRLDNSFPEDQSRLPALNLYQISVKLQVSLLPSSFVIRRSPFRPKASRIYG